MNSIEYRSSRKKIRTLLPITSSNVGSDKHKPAPSSLTGLPSHCLAGETFESNALVRVSKVNCLPRYGHLRSTNQPNTTSIFSSRNPSNLLSPHVETMQTRHEVLLLDGWIWWRHYGKWDKYYGLWDFSSTGSQSTTACAVGCTVLYVFTAVDWSVVVYSSYLCMGALVSALLRQRTTSTVSYLDYSQVYIWGKLWSLPFIITLKFGAFRGGDIILNATFLSQAIGPTMEVVLFKFVRTADCFWRTSAMSWKGTGSPSDLLQLRSVRLRKITVSSVIADIDHSRTIGHSGAHSKIRSWFDTCEIVFALSTAYSRR